MLTLARDKTGYWLPKKLTFEIGWSIDPSGSVKVKEAKAVLGIMPGLTLSAGSGVGLPPWPQMATRPDGSTVMMAKSLPEPPGLDAKDKGIGVMLNIDLLQLPILPRSWRGRNRNSRAWKMAAAARCCRARRPRDANMR